MTQLQDRFSAQYPSGLAGTFGAVGMMKDKLLAGEPCDVIILSEALITQLTASAHLVAGSAQALAR